MAEAIALITGVLIAGTGIAYAIQVRSEYRERDRLRKFQESMRATGRPSTQKRRK
jgi:predicted RND superfamily exporter protein